MIPFVQTDTNEKTQLRLGENKLGDTAIGQKHELFDELIGRLLHILRNTDGLACLWVEFEIELHALQLHRAAVVETRLAQHVAQRVQIADR